MISMVKRALVERHHWMNDNEFVECITLAQSLPGVFAVNMALYTGYKISGRLGGAFAMLGAALPSLVIIVVIAAFFNRVNENPTVRDVFRGIRPCVIGLILVPGLSMLRKSKLTLRTFWIPIATCVAICLLGVSPVYLIIAAIVAGLVVARVAIGRTRKNTRKQ